MGWTEMAAKIVIPANSTLASEDRGGWPPPDNSQFWEYAQLEEVSFILADQIPKYMSSDAEVANTMARSYLLLFNSQAHTSTENIEEATNSITDNGEYKEHIIAQIISTTLSMPDFTSKVNNLSVGMKALMWWGFWAKSTRHGSNNDYDYTQSSDIQGLFQIAGMPLPQVNSPEIDLDQRECVALMVNTLKLTPPEII
jgi:hypothetical protein